MTQPAIGTRKQAADGKEYEFWINEYQQRFWRAVEDHSVLIPYCVVVPEGVSTSDPQRPARDSWQDAIRSSSFWE